MGLPNVRSVAARLLLRYTASMSIDRAVVTLSQPVTATVHRMAAQMAPNGVEPPGPVEVVRRGLILLDLKLSLTDNEELVIRNKHTGECDRLRFGWELIKTSKDS